MDDLTAKVDALANRPAAAPDTTQTAPAPADQGAATQAVAELSSKVQSAFASEKQAVDDLNARIAKLEQGAGASESTSDRAIRLARVQGALVALEAGEKLGDVPGAPPAVTRFARTAAPTEASLRESFPAVAAHAREVSRPDVANRSFLERTLARLQQSVTVRQGDSVLVGDPAAGVLADAEEKVQTGDLAGAVTTLHTLTGPAADAVKNWVDQASALLAARSALADMAAHG